MSQKFHRVDYPKHVPDAFRGLYAASTAVHNATASKGKARGKATPVVKSPSKQIVREKRGGTVVKKKR